MSVEIKKAKIKSRLFLSYEYVVKEKDVENKNSTSSDAPIHEDLQNAFDSLIPHLVHICEEEILNSVSALEVERLISKYKVTGITISGSDDMEGVVISGYKTLASEKVVNFNTPFQKFSDDEYLFSTDLYNSVGILKTEVLEYMDGKQGTKSQVGTFDFGEEGEEESEAFSLPEGAIIEMSTSNSDDDEEAF